MFAKTVRTPSPVPGERSRLSPAITELPPRRAPPPIAPFWGGQVLLDGWRRALRGVRPHHLTHGRTGPCGLVAGLCWVARALTYTHH
jgi:hypothetical protein